MGCSTNDERLGAAISHFKEKVNVLYRSYDRNASYDETFIVEQAITGRLFMITVNSEGNVRTDQVQELNQLTRIGNNIPVIKSSITVDPVESTPIESNKSLIYCFDGTKAISENSKIYLLGVPNSYDPKILDREPCY